MDGHTIFSKNIYIHPIVACTRRSNDLHRRGQQRDQFLVPATHFAAGVPEGPEDGVEVAPAALF